MRGTVFAARDAPVAVVLRRAAGGWSQLHRWDLDSDEVTAGEWLHARIFPTRCDLSPDGRLFGFFAHDGRPHRDAEGWTAIVRPPHVTALAAWWEDSTWTTGPFFPAADRVWPGGGGPPDHGTLPRWLRTVDLPWPQPGREWTDRTVPLNRLRRDGWEAGDDTLDRWSRAVVHPAGRLEVIDPGAAWMHTVEGNGTRYRISWATASEHRTDLDVDSAAVDHRGRLLGVTAGRLLRWHAPEDVEMVAELSGRPPRATDPPTIAGRWPSPP